MLGRWITELRKNGLPTFSKPAIYMDKASVNARGILRETNSKFVCYSSEADLIWIRKGFKAYFDSIESDQLFNHLPEESILANKGKLTRYLKAYDAKQGKDNSIRLSDFYAKSYRLYSRKECREFIKQLPKKENEENLWILKPTNLSKGRGIHVTWDMKKLKKQLLPIRNDVKLDFGEGHRRYIIQKYIKDVLLLDGRKSEFRAYWVVASLDPLIVLLYNKGIVRLCSKPFELGDYDNPLVHVTNIFQQKHHPDYDPSIELKWTYETFEEYVCNTLNLAEPGFLQRDLQPRLRDIIYYIVSATRHRLCQPSKEGLCFALFGSDFILDKHLNPWLLEVQRGPGLSFSDPAKGPVLKGVLKETVKVVLEIQSRLRKGESLCDLSSIENFEVVIDEST